ncbi:TPA: chemotaxis protein CheB [Thermoplasmata archaeon]|nr:chemotaxis protein CheB [Thermoplasmata archaeon]
MFSASFAKRLDKVKGPKTLVASDGDSASEGHAYIAPGGFHLRVVECSKSRAHLTLDKDTPPVQFVKPSADVLFESASKCFGDRLLAVILTGMGRDGVNGAKAVKAAGGKVIVQDEKSSVIYGMPKAAAEAGVADKSISLEEIPEEIVRFLED